jgi:hypothetical protein
MTIPAHRPQHHWVLVVLVALLLALVALLIAADTAALTGVRF